MVICVAREGGSLAVTRHADAAPARASAAEMPPDGAQRARWRGTWGVAIVLSVEGCVRAWARFPACLVLNAPGPAGGRGHGALEPAAKQARDDAATELNTPVRA